MFFVFLFKASKSCLFIQCLVFCFRHAGHAFISYRVDYCNSLLFGFLNVCLLAMESVLNATAKLTARLQHHSHISTFMLEQLHWLPLSPRSKFKILILVSKTQRSLTPK